MRFYPTGSNGFVDVRDVAEITIALSGKEYHVSGQHLLVGEHVSYKDLFGKIAQEFGAARPVWKVPAAPMRFLAGVLGFLENWSISPFSITSENLKSAYRQSHYSNEKVRSLGFTFRTLEEAIQYTAAVYRAVN
jgi:nucleoside-diphosphate-sugar epimerase